MSITTPEPVPVASPEQAQLDREAFDRTADARAAMSVETVPRYTLDATYAVGKALWTSAKVLPFRPRMVGLAEFDIANLDQLETDARALNFAHTEILRRVEVLGQVPELAKEGYDLRELMMEYASLLSRKNVVAPALIARLREGAGYRDLAEDLDVLVLELRALPAGMIGETTPVTDAEVYRASEVAHEIIARVGNPATLDMTQETLLQERRKLGALLVGAQDQVRRAMSFLRWTEGDAAELAPSLYVPGGGRKPEGTDPVPATSEVVALHEQLHASAAAVHPDDNPFATED